MAISFLAVQELNERYNNDPRSFTDEEAEMIAGLSKQFGLEFQRTSRPLAKGAFDFADIASFGLLPNEWRPTSRGDLTYGETGLDKFAGGVGSVGGLFGAVGAGAGLWKGGQAAIGSFKTGDIVRKSAEGIQRSGRGLVDATKTAGSRAVDIGRNLGQAGATYGQLGIEQAASALSTKLGISIIAAKRLLAGTGIVGGGLGLNALLDDSEEPSFSGY